MERPSFLDMEAPAGYVAGAGRGAIGFGDAVIDDSRNRADPGKSGENGFNGDNDGDEEEDDAAVDNAGNDRDDDGITFNLAADEDDLDAVRIYSQIEARRLRKLKSPAPSSEISTSRFADLKRSLASVSNDEWENLQDPGDLTRKNKRSRLLEQMQQRSYAAPDSLIAGSSMDLNGAQPAAITDFTSISSARNQLWGNQLDQLVALASDNGMHPTASPNPTSEAQIVQIGDAAKTRSLLNNLRRTRPDLSLLWISSARLEELVGDRKAAIAVLDEGCRRLPHHEDVWLESIRIQESSFAGRKQCKSLVAQAIRYNRNLAKLWLKAVDLEHPADIHARRTVIMQALQQLPGNIGLWEMMISFETEEGEIIPLLTKATELCPEHCPFWLTLIDLSLSLDARKVLEKAHKALLGKPEVWIAAAKLEERENPGVSSDKIDLVLKEGFAEVAKRAEFCWPRIKWLESAAALGSLGYPLTANLIVNNALSADCEEPDAPPAIGNWLDDANRFSASSPLVACGIYQYISRCYPHETDALVELLDYFRSNNDISKLDEYYLLAISNNPGELLFRLMYAKDLWLKQNNVLKARDVLAEAHNNSDAKDEIYQAQIKLELRTSNPELAHAILLQRQSDESCDDPGGRHQLIHLERHLLSRGRLLVSRKTIAERSLESRTKFPASQALLVQWIQIQRDEFKDSSAARETARQAVIVMPESVALWLLLIELDAAAGPAMKARTTLDRALSNCPDSDEVWCSKVEFELAVGELFAARQWGERTVQRFPASPKAWLCHLRLITKSSHRRKAFVDALKATNNAAEIFLHIGVSLWKDKQQEKAQQWVERALRADCTNGDCWMWMTMCSDKVGNADDRARIKNEFEKNMDDITGGSYWLGVANSPNNLCKTPHEILDLAVKEATKSAQ